MPSKPNSHKWNDVQMVIATTAIATTLGLWNLFATPVKTVTATLPPPTLPPTDPPVAPQEPVSMPQVKIMFAQGAPQATLVQQPQPQVQKKKKNNGGHGSSVTQTKTS